LAILPSRISRRVIEFKLKANDSRALKGKDRFNEDGISTRDVSQNRARNCPYFCEHCLADKTGKKRAM